MYAAYSSILHSKEKTGRILGTWHQYLMNFRASALLRNIQNIRICMGEKTYRFCNQRTNVPPPSGGTTSVRRLIDWGSAWTPRYRWKIATRPETQITHTQGGRQSLVPVDINRKTTGARDCLPPRVWVIWVSVSARGPPRRDLIHILSKVSCF